MEEEKIMRKQDGVAEHVRLLGYHPVHVSLHGSQNYGLEVFSDEYQSDYDYKCIVLPNLWDLVKNSKPVSVVLDYEGGHIDVKDVRVFMDTMLKMNPSYLEGLLTPYQKSYDEGSYISFMYNYLPHLLNERGALFAKACYGMFKEKEKAMCHRYPTLSWKIDKWGYDGKQVHHMYRLLLMLRDFDRTGKMILIPPEHEKEFLIDLKLNRYPLEDAMKMVSAWEEEMSWIRHRLEERYKSVSSDTAQEMLRLSRIAVYLYCNTEKGRKVSDDDLVFSKGLSDV